MVRFSEQQQLSQELIYCTIESTQNQIWHLTNSRQHLPIARLSITFMVGDPQAKDKLAWERAPSQFQYHHKSLTWKIMTSCRLLLSTIRVASLQKTVKLLHGETPKTEAWYLWMALLAHRIKYCQQSSH